MKILVYGINFYPESIGVGKFTGEMSAWLSLQGNELRVVTAPPYYPNWHLYEGFKNRWRLEKSEGADDSSKFDIWRCPLWVPSKPSGLTRILHLASFALSSFPVMMRQIFWKPDVVWAVEPAFVCAPAAWLTAKLSGASSWLHVQDFEMDTALNLGLIRSAWFKRLAINLEHWLMKKFDRVSTISAGMLQNLTDKGVESGRQILFPNWVDVDAIKPMTGVNNFREQSDWGDDTVVLLYAGNMGEKQGLELLVKAAGILEEREVRQELPGKSIRFLLCGDGMAKDRLQKMASGLNMIHWLPLQPIDKLNELLNCADIHLLPQSASVADLVMPSKLTGMLASGRPTIATTHSETEVYRVVNNCGIAVLPDNVSTLVEAIVALANDPERRQKLGRAARRYAEENLDKETILRDFESELYELVNKKNIRAI
ncbi:MAG: glycosyltransferase WbuB [Nitrospirales bacterium]|nr:MAG: glycosyltransferase WbuB [Nitrospirales bacterium]